MQTEIEDVMKTYVCAAGWSEGRVRCWMYRRISSTEVGSCDGIGMEDGMVSGW